MGYIPAFSSFTCSNSIGVQWTALGRKYLMSFGSAERSQIYYFSLSDTDKNYINTLEVQPDFIPNITGDMTSCLIPTASNRVRHELNVQGLSASTTTIDYRSKPLKACDVYTIDCSRYYDMYPLSSSDTRSSEILGDSIWTCIIGNFGGSLV